MRDERREGETERLEERQEGDRGRGVVNISHTTHPAYHPSEITPSPSMQIRTITVSVELLDILNVSHGF